VSGSMTPEGRKSKRPEGKSRGKMPESRKAKGPEGKSAWKELLEATRRRVYNGNDDDKD